MFLLAKVFPTVASIENFLCTSQSNSRAFKLASLKCIRFLSLGNQKIEITRMRGSTRLKSMKQRNAEWMIFWKKSHERVVYVSINT